MHPRLSARQEQCLRLTAFRTDKEIAAHLGISEATVKKHVHEACQRLGVNRRKAALALLDPIVPETSAGKIADALAGDPQKPVDPSTPGSDDRGPDRADVLPSHRPDGGRIGYRPPPRNPALRIVLVVGLTIILAAFVATTVVMLGEMHEAVGKIDARVYPGAAEKTS